ncbi:MAG: ribosomal protein S18-alanine N-acetyltransferase [Thermoflexales bacterium]|nr:ribosomal protein S18-alanine N-acetyltransferase [Thermoflexales bacterium]
MNASTHPSEPFPFLFRPMREEDIAEVMEIERHSFSHPWPESAYRHEIRYGTDSLFYVLQPYREPSPTTWWDRLLRRRPGERSPIVGYVGIRFLPGEAHITTIAVHPEWRGRGLGKYILLMAIQRAMQHRVRFVTLEVRASNRVAQQLYTDLGFRVTGVQRGYYRDGEDAWLMQLGPLDGAEMERLEEIRRATEARVLTYERR